MRIYELRNKEYLAIIKFCENKDYDGLNMLLEGLYLAPDLNIFDRFYVLMYVRRLFVGSSITFNGKDDINISYSLGDMLDKLEDNYVDTSEELTYNNITLGVGVPVGSYFNDIDDLYNDTIRFIKYKDKERINFTALTGEEKSAVMDRLPTHIFLLLQTYITDMSGTLFDLTLIEENKALDIPEMSINILGNGVMHFLSSIFAYDLVSFYETMYYYNNIIGGNDFFDLTFNEVQLLISIHEERMKRENDETQKNNTN